MEYKKKYMNMSRKILLFIYLPFLINIFMIQRLDFYFAYIIFCVQLIIFIYSVVDIRFAHKKRQVSIYLLFLVLFLISLNSSFSSEFQYDVVKSTIYILGTSFLLIFLVYSDENPQKTFNKISFFHMIIGSIFSIIALFLFLFGTMDKMSNQTVQIFSVGPFKLFQIIMGSPPYRVSSLTTNPNTLGMFLMISQIFTIYLYKTKAISKRKGIILYILQISTLFLTQSRSAILGTGIMIFVFIMFNSKNNKNRIKLIYILILLGIGTYFLIITEDTLIFSRLGLGLSKRNLPWKIIINSFKENIFGGVGYGVSGYILYEKLGIKAHNVFLNILYELGIVGFIVFITIWILGIVYAYKNYKTNSKDNKTMYLTILSILFALLFQEMFENKLLVYDFFMFLWVYLITFVTY